MERASKRRANKWDDGGSGGEGGGRIVTTELVVYCQMFC